MPSAIVQVTQPDRGLGGLQRVGLGVLGALVIVFLLYWLMSALVAAGRGALTDAPEGRIVDFVRVPEPPQLRTKQPKPEKPPKPQAAPDTPQQQADPIGPTAGGVNIGKLGPGNVAVNTDASVSASEGDYLPIVKVAPQYPPRAQSRGIEGWVLLEFTVTKTGSVANPRVVDAKPEGIFNEAAKRAVLRFKYKPRVVDGQPQQVTGVQHLIRFELED